jgi:hypothetical protein
MRTTLEIDNAVLAAAKEVAQARKVSAGAVISDWARKGLNPGRVAARRRAGGFPVFPVPPGAEPLISTTVKSLLDDEGLPARR